MDARIVGAPANSVAQRNARYGKLVSYATRVASGGGRDAETQGRIARARDAFREARGDDSAVVNPFEIVNGVLDEDGIEPFPIAQTESGPRYIYYEGDSGPSTRATPGAVPSPGRAAFDSFVGAYALQREIAEMCLYVAIDNYNSAIDIASGGRPIMMSEARQAHDEWLSRYASGDALSPADSLQAVLRERFGIEMSVAEMGRVAGYVRAVMGVDGNGSPTRIYPVSPYDDRFRDLSSTYERGARLGFIDLASMGDGTLSVADLASPVNNDVVVSYARRQSDSLATTLLSTMAEGGLDALGASRVDVPIVDASDLAGLGRLRPYMRPEEYSAMVEHVSRAWEPLLADDFDWRSLGLVAESSDIVDMAGSSSSEAARDAFFRNVDAAVSRSVAICQALTDAGYDYEVRMAREVGQVELAVKDTGVTVRLMDRPREINFIGRVSDRATATQSYVVVEVERDRAGFSADGRSLADTMRAEFAPDEYSAANNRIDLASVAVSLASGFDVDPSVFVDNVMYTLGADVMRVDGQRLGEGERFSVGKSTGAGVREAMYAGTDTRMRVGDGVASGHVTIRTETDGRARFGSANFDSDPTPNGAKLAIAAMVTAARREFEYQVNVPELAEAARREAQAAFDSGSDERPDEMPVPDDVAFGEHALSDPSVSRLREAYWRAMCAYEYDALVAARDGVEPPAPRYALANMGFDHDRIYETLGGVLVDSDSLDAYIEDGVDADVVRMDAYTGPFEATLSRGASSVSAHLEGLMNDYFGCVVGLSQSTGQMVMVNYFDLGSIDDEAFESLAGRRAYLRHDGEMALVGCDSEELQSKRGDGTYFRRGAAELGSVSDALEGTAFEDAGQLTSEVLTADMVSVDVAHTLAFQPKGAYMDNQSVLRSAYLRISDEIAGTNGHEENAEYGNTFAVISEEERGTTRFLDSTLRFGDGDVAVTSLSELRQRSSEGELDAADSYRLRMLDAVERTLLGTRCVVSADDIQIDGNGIVRYEAARVREVSAKGGKRANTDQHVVGTLGQLFAPEEHGLFDVRFASSEGYLLAGGNFLHILNQMSNSGSPIERMRIETFEDRLEREVCREVRNQIVGARTKSRSVNEVGMPTSLNAFWRDDVVGTRFSADFFSDDLMDEETRSCVVGAACAKCRIVGFDPQEETAIVNTERLSSLDRHAWVCDIEHGGQGVMGRRETTHLEEDETSIFDFRVLPNDKKSAQIRYLNDDVTIGEDGRLIGGEPMGHSALTRHSALAYSDCDAWNRIQMGSSNTMHATSITEDTVAFAQVPCGFVTEDSIIVSAEFAANNLIHGVTETRPLTIGDKIGETHGNKGLIAYIVDPDMDVDEELRRAREQLDDDESRVRSEYEQDVFDITADTHLPEAERNERMREAKSRLGRALHGIEHRRERVERDTEGVRGIVDLFRANTGKDDRPNLSVVYSPFSPLSRRNAGLAREAISNQSYPLTLGDGTEVAGGIGMARFVIHDKAADKKTSTKNGRTSGYQLGHLLQGEGCEKTLSDVYASNSAALRSLREAARTSYGFDIDEGGNLSREIAYPDANDASVYRFDENLVITDSGTVSESSVDDFMYWMMVRGGYVELPFSLTWPAVDVEMSASEAAALSVASPDSLIEYDAEKGIAHIGGNEMPPSDMHTDAPSRYLMPVMSAEERRGTTTSESGYRPHDHTNSYRSIFAQAINYESATRKAAERDAVIADERVRLEAMDAEGKSGSERDKLEQSILTHTKQRDAAVKAASRAQSAAQSAFNALALEVRNRAFDGRSNYAKTKFMGADMPGRYGTAPWTGDPRLPFDEVGVGPKLARELGLREGDRCLLWRAPCLTSSTARAFTVHVDESLTGVSINPEVANPIGGDFDGDTIGIGRPYSRESMAEMSDKLALSRELIDRHHAKHGLTMGRDTDITFAGYQHPEIRERIDDIERRARAVFDRYDSAGMTSEGRLPLLDDDGNEVKGRNGKVVMKTYAGAMRPYLEELSDVVCDAFAHTVGGGALSFADAGSYLQSVIDLNVDTKVKGSIGAVEALGRALGVDHLVINEDESGRHVIDQSVLVDTGHTLQDYEDYQSTQDAAALKSYATGEVGMFQQRMFAAFPGEVAMANALSEPLYQMSLDWKHDGAVARQQHALISTFNGLFAGGAYEMVDGELRQIWDKCEDGSRVRAVEHDAERWKSNVLACYHAVDKDGFDMRYLDRMTELLWKDDGDGTGHIMGFAERAREVASPLERAAFTDRGDAFVSAALSGRNLFLSNTGDAERDFEISGAFAPQSARDELARILGLAEVETPGEGSGDAELYRNDEQKSQQDFESVIAGRPEQATPAEIGAIGEDVAARIGREPADDSDIAVVPELATSKEDETREVE